MTRGVETGVAIEWHTGDRQELRSLFELAEDSATELDSYLSAGRVLVARTGSDIVGHLQLLAAGEPGHAEIKNMAVREDHQGRGLGRRLVQAASRLLAAEEVATVRVRAGRRWPRGTVADLQLVGAAGVPFTVTGTSTLTRSPSLTVPILPDLCPACQAGNTDLGTVPDHPPRQSRERPNGYGFRRCGGLWWFCRCVGAAACAGWWPVHSRLCGRSRPGTDRWCVVGGWRVRF